VAIYTDFFVTSEDELRAAFPYRFPVAKRPKTHRGRNPFTGQVQVVKEWGPAEPFPELPEGVTYPSKAEVKAVHRFPLAQFKGVDQVKLATLQALVSGGELQSHIEELCRPALVAPGKETSFLYRLPLAWVEAIAGIKKVAPLAKDWAATEECQLDNWTAKDASEVIGSLRELAKRAVAESKGMFLWVNM
jgi:hypothetical protein